MASHTLYPSKGDTLPGLGVSDSAVSHTMVTKHLLVKLTENVHVWCWILSQAVFLTQVDLSLEAKNLWAFNFNFRFNPDVRFPFPIYPLVAPAVLVETFEEGHSIAEYVDRGPGAMFNSR